MRAPHDQHFLADEDAVGKIASFTDIDGVTVLEIGPGRGVLTRALLDRGAKVIAVELDGTLLPHLESAFADEIAAGKLTIVHGDAIRCEIPPFEKVVANLPYSASSKITFRLLDIGFKEAVLMYQKEFGERMIALPGSPDCGRLSVMVQTYAKVMPLLELGPESFSPPPEVDSWVVKITPKSEPTYPISDRKLYAVLVREAFSHRRKTLKKALQNSAHVIGKDVTASIIANAPEDLLKKRAEELTLKEWAMLTDSATATNRD